MKKRFIVFEGLSGVGKSTISREVAKHISAVFLATPPAPYDNCRNHIDIAVNSDARFYFYVSGLVHASSQIKKYLATTNVVCDRYLPSTLAYHKAMGVDVDSMFPPDIRSQKLVMPDQLFLLTCSDESERKKRMKERGLSFNDKDEMVRNLDKQVLETYQTFNPIIIETAGKPKELVIEEVVASIKL